MFNYNNVRIRNEHVEYLRKERDYAKMQYRTYYLRGEMKKPRNGKLRWIDCKISLTTHIKLKL